MKKIIAMIPVRLGSKRVPNKNLRLLGNKPLVAHIIEAAKEANVFDEIVINSESDIFKEIADEYGVKFYKRPEHLSTDEATNDDFTLDFMHNINGDMLKVDEDFLELINKLQQYYQKFKSKWSRILASRKKTGETND